MNSPYGHIADGNGPGHGQEPALQSSRTHFIDDHDHDQQIGADGIVDMYDEGERSPLTANAQYPAGYPPIVHSQPTFLGKDPYYHGYSNGNGGTQSMDYLPPAGFNTPGTRPDGRPGFSHQTSRAESDIEWQKRARMPTRGKTTKVKLRQGNFIHEYPVPSPIRNSVEAKWMTMGEFRNSSTLI